jgi:microcystin-dependent protein
MSDPYVGEIRIFAGNFAPAGWALCEGQLMSISENSTLYNLIGTTYGGDGQSTFGLPDLRGRSPVHQGTNQGIAYVVGSSGGVETVQLTTAQLPVHTHAPQASTGANGNPVNSPAGAVWSGWTGGQYTTQTPTSPLNATAIANNGGSQPHDNMVPFQVINFIISLYGVYPSQS